MIRRNAFIAENHFRVLIGKDKCEYDQSHLGRGLLEYFLYKGVGFGEEVTYSIHIFRARLGATKTLNLAIIEVKLNVF